jgi:hypothetical protein
VELRTLAWQKNPPCLKDISKGTEKTESKRLKYLSPAAQAFKTSSQRCCGDLEHAAIDARLYMQRTNGFCTHGSAPGTEE